LTRRDNLVTIPIATAISGNSRAQNNSPYRSTRLTPPVNLIDTGQLIVVLLSQEYPRKRWCRLEWRWIRQLLVSPAQERIMLLRVGDPGDPSEISARILGRKAQLGIPIPEAADPGLGSCVADLLAGGR